MWSAWVFAGAWKRLPAERFDGYLLGLADGLSRPFGRYLAKVP